MSQKPLFRQIRIRDKETGEIRLIQDGDISRCSSPIAPLLRTVASSIGQIVPERKADLIGQIDGGISIEIDGVEETFCIEAVVPKKKVILGLAALERTWAWIYFYLALVDVVDRNPKGADINLTELPSLQPARHLASWALDCEKMKRQSAWPDGLPRPDRDDGSDDRIALVQPYFYHALCFLMLHEIGHINHQHQLSKFVGREMSYNHEFEADEWAASFILRDWEKAGRGEKDFIGRCTGITLGLAVLASVEVSHHEKADDHPTIANRLLEFYAKHNPESVGEASAERDFPSHLASVVIQAHFLNENIPFDFTKQYKDMTEYLVAAHRAMAEHKHR